MARQTIKTLLVRSKTNPFPIDTRLHFGSGMNLKTNKTEIVICQQHCFTLRQCWERGFPDAWVGLCLRWCPYFICLCLTAVHLWHSVKEIPHRKRHLLEPGCAVSKAGQLRRAAPHREHLCTNGGKNWVFSALIYSKWKGVCDA